MVVVIPKPVKAVVKADLLVLMAVTMAVTFTRSFKMVGAVSAIVVVSVIGTNFFCFDFFSVIWKEAFVLDHAKPIRYYPISIPAATTAAKRGSYSGSRGDSGGHSGGGSGS